MLKWTPELEAAKRAYIASLTADQQEHMLLCRWVTLEELKGAPDARPPHPQQRT